MEDLICFTTDIDWAPECAIEELLDFFVNNEIRPTVFVTHESEIVKKYQDKIDIGIHPNFVMPSSQGETINEVIDYCQKLVPDTKCFRSHRWYASNDVYDEMRKRGFLYESNICTDMEIISPFKHRSGLISFPVFFEDGAYIQFYHELDYKNIRMKFQKRGLKVLNFHPMHFALNTPYFKYTRDIKDKLSREQWNNMKKNELNQIRNREFGIREVIEDIVYDAKHRGAKITTLKEQYEHMCQL